MKDYIALLIPLSGIVMGCGIPMLVIFLDYRKRKEMFTLHHQERMAAIEKGIELPPLSEEFFKDGGKHEKNRTPHADLGWGLFWLLAGMGLFAALYFNDKTKTAWYALIPVAIGLHYLIYYYVVGKKEALAIEAGRRTNADKLTNR